MAFDFFDLLGRSWSQNSTSCAVTLAFFLPSAFTNCVNCVLLLWSFKTSKLFRAHRKLPQLGGKERERIFGLLTECSCCVVATDVRDAFQLLRACKSSTSSAVGLRIDPPFSTSASMCEEAFMSACQQLWSCVKLDSLMHIGWSADLLLGSGLGLGLGLGSGLGLGGWLSRQQDFTFWLGYTGQNTSIFVHGMCCTKFVTLVQSRSGRWGTMGEELQLLIYLFF